MIENGLFGRINTRCLNEEAIAYDRYIAEEKEPRVFSIETPGQYF
jgi:hypothetical protein